MILLRVDPSRMARARIRPPVLSTPCLYQISCFHYSSHSCTISLPSSHVEMNSFMRRTYPYALFIHTSHTSMHSCATSTRASYHTHSSPFMYQPRCLYPLASCLLYHIHGPIPPCLYLLLTMYQVGCLAPSQGDTSSWV